MELDDEIFLSDETGADSKIYHSDFIRVIIPHENNLSDLLCVTPATPIPVKIPENETCPYEPKCEKYYVPKRRSRLKVRTVRDIRNQFEQENYSSIVEDMEKQQNVLLGKIRTGSAYDSDTQNLAKILLKADHPISRTAWQMLSNINPERKANPTQFVLWDGRRIRVVGSKGGKTKFISNYDLEKNDKEVKEKRNMIARNTKKNCLLRNSLSIKLKPGPLGRKTILDDSYQRYHVGPIELVKLPKPALDIHPAIGKVVEPVMANFLNKLRPDDGTISEKWAEFTVSVLGTVKNNGLIQYDPECCVTFDLSYKYAQNRILMRRDIFNVPPTNAHETALSILGQSPFQNKSIKREVKTVMDNILDSVEISLMQDSMYADKKESHQNSPEPEIPNEDNTILVKEKSRKKFGELDRLAVTVIRLPGTPKTNLSKSCGKAYCNLGCVCDSLSCTYKFKEHCGYPECMFACKCKMSKFKDIELLESGFSADLIPGLMNLDNANITNLSKEEQKFHQTVVIKGEKSILMKPKKRNTKFSKEYEQFFSNIRLKNEAEPKKILTIVDKKLNVSNIEPWCMVHNLYRCFCKGRFTESATLNFVDSIPTSSTADLTNAESTEPSLENIKMKNHINESVKPSRHCSEESSERENITLFEVCLKDINLDETFTSCARVNAYVCRKYDDKYYKIMNYKIIDMEQNDTTLHNKLLKLMKVPARERSPSDPRIEMQVDYSSMFENSKKQSNDNLIRHTNLNGDGPVKSNESRLKTKVISDSLQIQSNAENINTQSIEPYIPFEISGDLYKPVDGKKITQDFLTPWIAKSYKHYIEQSRSGKNTLERPKKGRIILHLWESLLERFTSHRNIFLTTKKGPPFRIYIATDINKPFFSDCININLINVVDIHKYPCVVRKLVTRSVSKDYFCILGGWDDCWEIIGSVKKNDKRSDGDSSDSNLSKTENSWNASDESQENCYIHEQLASTSEIDCLQDNNKKTIQPEIIERSKWFLMKLENDFTDIYCQKKGFYVEHEKLIQAINLARLTNKTVVINKQTSTKTENIPFGIYALPMMTGYLAVVGPYELEEPLGLEIVKSRSVLIQKSTKGYWLTTNKVDNAKVLHDPIGFLPQGTQNRLSILSDIIQKNDVSGGGVKSSTTPVDKISKNVHNIGEINGQKEVYANGEITLKKIPKLVKPIKIRRTNGFYHLTPNNTRISKNTLPSTSPRVKCLAKNSLINEQKCLRPINCQSDIEIKESGAIPVSLEPETASSLKIISVYSENVDEIAKQNGKPGVSILNPKQINKKIDDDKTSSKDEDELDMDIKNFLSAPVDDSGVDNGEYLVISDDDDDNSDDETASNVSQKWSDVWIQCSNIKNLGFIHGKRNSDNWLSIDFPGFERNKLYTESEAMDKINDTMSARIAMPEQVKLKWQVLSRKDSENIKNQLNNYNSATNSQSAGSSTNYRLRITKKTTPTARTSQVKPNLFDDLPNPGVTVLNQDSELFQGLDKTSRLLEVESDLLMNEAEKKQSEISDIFKFPENSRLKMSETLQEMMTMNDDLDVDN